MNLRKQNRIEKPEYLEYVKTLASVISGHPADDPHHPIGLGRRGGTKEHDIFAIPLTRYEHTEMHNNPEMWPDQYEYILRTIEKAFRDGVIVFDMQALKQLSKREY